MKEEAYEKANKLFRERKKLNEELKVLPEDGDLSYYRSYCKLVRCNESGREIEVLRKDIDTKQLADELRRCITERIRILEEEIEKL